MGGGGDPSITNGLASTNYVNNAVLSYIPTSSLPGLTNGFVTASITNGLGGGSDPSITNGLASTNYVNAEVAKYIPTSSLPALTNGYVKASITNGFVTASITNGLASTSITNGFLTAGATNGFVSASITNGLASTNYVNNAVGAYIPTSSLPALTNGFVTASITNGLGGGGSSAPSKVPISYAIMTNATYALSAGTAYKLPVITLVPYAVDVYTNFASNVYTFNTNYTGYYSMSASAKITQTQAAATLIQWKIIAGGATNSPYATFGSITMNNSTAYGKTIHLVDNIYRYTGGVVKVWCQIYPDAYAQTLDGASITIKYVGGL